MSGQPRIFTSRYRAVQEFHASGLRPGFTPVRTSLGAPKFLPESNEWPYMKELAPVGAFGLPDEEFKAAYINRLDRIGAQRIDSRFRAIAEHYPGQPLALLCFEDVTTSWCHRTLFAGWWEQQTGEKIEERNQASLLPVSGWTWTETGWQPIDSPERPPVQLSINRRAR